MSRVQIELCDEENIYEEVEWTIVKQIVQNKWVKSVDKTGPNSWMSQSVSGSLFFAASLSLNCCLWGFSSLKLSFAC